MQIQTSRFGTIQVETDDLLLFPAGLPGLEGCRQWILLPDSKNDAFAWLQNLEHSGIAFAVTSPQRYIPHYRVRVNCGSVEGLKLQNPSQAEILVIIGKSDSGWTLNLKAPLVINPDLRIGKQIICDGNEPVRYEIRTDRYPLKKTA
jgi:flagellar assembly factor FliW